jgi:hypothetical protein
MIKKALTYLFFLALMSFGNESFSFDFSLPADSLMKKKREMRNKHPLHRFYGATGAELIFSFADVRADSMTVTNKVRFSLFPHVQQQGHYNFSKHFGFYTGLSLINVGFKNNFQLNDTLQFELRQRSMSLGVPLALKLGNMEKGNYIALGCSAELMFHYKYKLFYQDEKIKYKDWFSEEVNLFNPSLFVDFRNKTGGYIRFKYYLNNFLPVKNSVYLLPESMQQISVSNTQSVMFYVSVGSTFMKKKPRKLTLDDV